MPGFAPGSEDTTVSERGRSVFSEFTFQGHCPAQLVLQLQKGPGNRANTEEMPKHVASR